MPVDGGAPTLFPLVRIPAQWSADGRSLLFMQDRGGATNLWRQALTGGAPVQLTRVTDETIYAWSAQQKRWAFVRGSLSRDVVLVSERR